MPDFWFIVEEDVNDNLVTIVNGSTARHKVTNKLKDFTMVLTKKDTMDIRLAGANFRLRGMDGLAYDKTLTNGPTYTFDQLKPGCYLSNHRLAIWF